MIGIGLQAACRVDQTGAAVFLNQRGFTSVAFTNPGDSLLTFDQEIDPTERVATGAIETVMAAAVFGSMRIVQTSDTQIQVLIRTNAAGFALTDATFDLVVTRIGP